MSFSTTQTTLYSQKLYSEKLEILHTNSLRLITISFLFIPFTFSIFPVIHFYYFSGTKDITEFEPFNLFLLETIFTYWRDLRVLTFTFFVILPATAAGVELITYSTHQGITHNEPITFSSTIKSLSNSYIYVVYTIILGSMKLIRNSLILAVSPLLLTASIEGLGFHFKYSILANTIFSCIIPLNILYFIVIWGSAIPIAVLESKLHFKAIKPLQHSANQSFEFRLFSLCTVFLTGFGISPALSYAANQIGWTTTWISTLEVCFICLNSSLMILLYMMANTVLYVQYKPMCGEEIGETTVEGELSGDDYVSLA